METDPKIDQIERVGHVFQLSEEERSRQIFVLRYNAFKDTYSCGIDGNVQSKGWKSFAFTLVNMAQYLDPESGKRYFTRKTGYRSASISWKFDFRWSGFAIDTISCITHSKTESGGNITYDMLTEDKLSAIKPGEVNIKSEKDNKEGHSGWETLLFIAYLDVCCSFQEDCCSRTQFLYQDSENDYPLDILITLKPYQRVEIFQSIDEAVVNHCVCDRRPCRCQRVSEPTAPKKSAKRNNRLKNPTTSQVTTISQSVAWPSINGSQVATVGNSLFDCQDTEPLTNNKKLTGCTIL